MSTAIIQQPFPWYQRIFPFLPGKKPAPQPAAFTPQNGLELLVGREGQVLSEILPGYLKGKIMIGTKVYQACCRFDGNPLYEGEWVRVASVKLNWLVVERNQHV